MNPWTWLTTPDPDPGFSTRKLGKIALRFVIFIVILTGLEILLNLTPLRPYLNTWWGSALFVVAMYALFFRFITTDLPQARRAFGAQGTGGRGTGGSRPGAKVDPKKPTSAQRRAERNRYAGVKKGAPKGGGRR